MEIIHFGIIIGELDDKVYYDEFYLGNLLLIIDQMICDRFVKQEEDIKR